MGTWAWVPWTYFLKYFISVKIDFQTFLNMHLRMQSSFLQFFQALIWKKVTSFLIIFLYESFSELKLFIATTSIEKYSLKFIIRCSISSV